MERQTDQAQVAVERERLAAVIAPQPEVRERIIAARQRADMEWLREWESDQRRRVADGSWVSPAAPAPMPEAAPAPMPAPPPPQDWRPFQEGGVRQGPPPTQAWAPSPGGNGRPADQPPTRVWEQAPPTRPMEQPTRSTGQPPRRAGERASRSRPWEQRPGLLARVSFGLLGRSAATRGQPESWREWPTNTGTPSPDGVASPNGVGGQSVP
jgi:hypothetical protein